MLGFWFPASLSSWSHNASRHHVLHAYVPSTQNKTILVIFYSRFSFITLNCIIGPHINHSLSGNEMTTISSQTSVFSSYKAQTLYIFVQNQSPLRKKKTEFRKGWWWTHLIGTYLLIIWYCLQRHLELECDALELRIHQYLTSYQCLEQTWKASAAAYSNMTPGKMCFCAIMIDMAQLGGSLFRSQKQESSQHWRTQTKAVVLDLIHLLLPSCCSWRKRQTIDDVS